MSTAFLWDARKPCGDCPYRKDAPLKLWHREEFEKLLASENTQFGSIYGCHKQNGQGCVGWLLDQLRRNCPSISLRLAAIRDDAPGRSLVACMKEATDGGHKLFPSIEAMCRANGVRRKSGRTA